MKLKTMMKRIAALGMAVVMMTGFTACGSEKEDVIKIGIVQMVENGAFNDMRQGFIDELEAKVTVKIK